MLEFASKVFYEVVICQAELYNIDNIKYILLIISNRSDRIK